MKIKPLPLAISVILLSQMSQSLTAQAAINENSATEIQSATDVANLEQNTEANQDLPVTFLAPLTVTATATAAPSSLAFGNAQKASDVVIDNEKLRHRSATLGNALADELGVHSNPFGGGSSAPVIRGQDGVRIKVLQNGTDVVDVSNM